MNKHPLALQSLLAAALVATAFSAPVSDPLRHFRSTATLESKSEILSMTVDINGDGKDDWLLSATGPGFDNGSAKLWRVYLSDGSDQFTSTPDPVSIPSGWLAKSIIDETQERALISYHPDGIEHGVITKLSVVNGAVGVTPVERVQPNGEDADYVKALFADSARVTVSHHDPASIALLPNAGTTVDESLPDMVRTDLTRVVGSVAGGRHSVNMVSPSMGTFEPAPSSPWRIWVALSLLVLCAAWLVVRKSAPASPSRVR